MLGMKLEHHLKSLLESNDGMRRHWCRLDADKPLIHDSIVCLLWLSAWLSLRSSVLEWWALGYMVACRCSTVGTVTVVLRGCTHIQSLIAYSLSNTIVFLLWVAATASWVCQTTTIFSFRRWNFLRVPVVERPGLKRICFACAWPAHGWNTWDRFVQDTLSKWIRYVFEGGFCCTVTFAYFCYNLLPHAIDSHHGPSNSCFGRCAAEKNFQKMCSINTITKQSSMVFAGC